MRTAGWLIAVLVTTTQVASAVAQASALKVPDAQTPAVSGLQVNTEAAASQPHAGSPAEPQADRFTNQPIGRGAPDANGGQSAGVADPTAGANDTLPQTSMVTEALRVVAALVLVVGVIFALRKLVRRFMPSAAPLPAKAVRLVGRTAIGPRQQVLLLQVGRRLVVVGDSGQQLSPLAEVTDPDEVAAVLGQASPGHAPFGRMLEAQRDEFETDADDPRAVEQDEAPMSIGRRLDEADEPNTVEAHNELSGLAQRIKLLSSQFKRSTGG